MKKTPSEKKPLAPRNFLDVEGKIIYSEGDQAWKLIRLRKDLLNEFHQLKEKSQNFHIKSFILEALRNFKQNEEDKEREVLPMLVWFYRE
jgi:hypothetical protein